MQNSANWIWCKDQIAPDAYTAFRRTFTLEKSVAHPELLISADSDFSLFVNGKLVVGSQFSDFPTEKTYSRFDVKNLLQIGKNVIAVIVHYIGENFLRDAKGYPGLYLALRDGEKVLLASDENFRAIPAPGYRSNWQQKFTRQLGFCTWFDARVAGALEWMNVDFDDSSWASAKIIDAEFSRTLAPRPLAELLQSPPPPVAVLQLGVLRRREKSDRPAREMFRDLLRPLEVAEALAPDGLAGIRPVDSIVGVPETIILTPDAPDSPLRFAPLADSETNGYYLVVELPKEIVGYIRFDLVCSAGTVVDYALGEHLFSGRVRAAIEARNFADRYIAREGENHFEMRLRRAAGRYLELHFTECAAPPKVLYAGVVEQYFPLPELADFSGSDRLVERTVGVAVDTLKNCMHEHYEDCPWREQSLYAYDSRNQALYGYYLWGNYDFAETSFRLLGHSKGEKFAGFLPMTEPSDVPLTIPVFSLAWIADLYEFFWHSGKIELFRAEAETVKTILRAATRNRTAHGLYHPGNDQRFWHFSEWVPGLRGENYPESATYNLYLYEALTLAAKLFAAAGLPAPDYAAQAKELGENIERTFYSPERGLYLSNADDPKLFHEHTQALMLYLELVPESRRERFLAEIARRDTIKCTFSSLPFLVRGLMREPAWQNFAAQIVADAFEPLVMSGATTLWETPIREDFNGSLSLCHGWSSLPAYFAKRYILGVEPLAPGFAQFAVKPYTGTLEFASGAVPTPFGEIRVSWQKRAFGVEIQVENPPGTTRVEA